MGDRISSTASSSVKDNDSPMRKALFNTSSLIGHQWENRERWGDRCCRWKTDWNQLLLAPWDCQLLVIQPGYLGTAPSTDHLWRPLNLLPYYSSHTPRANLPLHRGLRADWQTCDTPPPTTKQEGAVQFRAGEIFFGSQGSTPAEQITAWQGNSRSVYIRNATLIKCCRGPWRGAFSLPDKNG